MDTTISRTDFPDLLDHGLRSDFDLMTKAMLVEFCRYADDFTPAHERMLKDQLVELADAHVGYHCWYECAAQYHAEYHQLAQNFLKLHPNNTRMHRKMGKLVQRKRRALIGALTCLQPYAEATRSRIPNDLQTFLHLEF